MLSVTRMFTIIIISISILLFIPVLILLLQGVRGGAVDHTKSNLDNIVGSLWQARQESSGSSVGNQVTRRIGDFLDLKYFCCNVFKYFLFPLNALFCEQARIIRSTCAIIQTIFHDITIQVIRIPSRVEFRRGLLSLIFFKGFA